MAKNVIEIIPILVTEIQQLKKALQLAGSRLGLSAKGPHDEDLYIRWGREATIAAYPNKLHTWDNDPIKARRPIESPAYK